MDVLVVEDEKKLAEALQEGLEADHYSVQISHSGEEGFYLVQARAFDLMILDIMLPGHDGLEILTTLRKHGIKTPVLLLTARDSIEDRVRGLDSGADDYLVKPFAFSELQARARALLRRGKPDVDRRFKLMDLELDAARRSVARGGHSIELTTREFDLLEYLFTHVGRVVSREMLARYTRCEGSVSFCGLRASPNVTAPGEPARAFNALVRIRGCGSACSCLRSSVRYAILAVQTAPRSLRGRGDRDRRKPPFFHSRRQASIAGLFRKQS